jgi:transposase-like protein
MNKPFPASLLDFQTVFPDEETCRHYLVESRWPDGFLCPHCGGKEAWGQKRLVCRSCRRETSVLSGGIMDHSHLPLRTWFWAAYMVCVTPGVNALTLGRLLKLKSRKNAWSLLDRLREAMTAYELPKLSGEVEADEIVIGGYQAGGTGFSGANKKIALVLVERGSGRTRMVQIPVIAKLVDPGSTIITDGHDGYRGLIKAGFHWVRIPHPLGGLKRGENRATPAADGAVSLFKRWLLATYNRPPSDLARYLGEFCFRQEFRRQPESAFSTLLGLAVKTSGRN